MKKKIFKYPLEVEDNQQITLPIGAEILCVQVQNGIPCLYALLDPEEKDSAIRYIETFGTGHSISGDTNRTYVGTYQLQNGAFVGHVFEKVV